jgi:hypothetical protein
MRRYLFAVSALLVTTVACAGVPGTKSFGGALQPTEPAAEGNEPGPTPTPTATPTPAPVFEGESSGGEVPAGEPPPEPPGGPANPFEDPPSNLPDFPPLPEDLPPDKEEEFGTPHEGLWTVVNYSGSISCPGYIELDIPESAPEQGTITVIEPNQSFVASGLGTAEEGQTAEITFTADPPVQGRYIGTVDVMQEGITLTIVYHVLMGWPEYMLGYLESDYEVNIPDVGDVRCRIERPYELTYTGGGE